MKNIQIFIALAIGVIGYWSLTAVSNQAVTHILVSNTAVFPTQNRDLVVTFNVENRGAPDRLIGVSKSDGHAALRGGGVSGLAVPTGNSALTLEAGHILLPDVSGTFENGEALAIDLEFEVAGAVSVLVRYKSADVDEVERTLSLFKRGVDLVPSSPIPSVSLSAVPQSTGWRISLATENFALGDGETTKASSMFGVVDLFADGMHIGKVSQTTTFIGSLRSGPVVLTAVPRSPNGEPYFANGELIEDQLQIDVGKIEDPSELKQTEKQRRQSTQDKMYCLGINLTADC